MRSHTPRYRASDLERAQLEIYARAHGLTVSEALRHLVEAGLRGDLAPDASPAHAHGAAKPEAPALGLYLCSGRWFIGFGANDDAGRFVLRDPCIYNGGTIMKRSAEHREAVEIHHPKDVSTVDGLCSLKEIPITPDATVMLAELDRREAKEIEARYHACQDMIRNVRAQLAGITPALIVPGRA